MWSLGPQGDPAPTYTQTIHTPLGFLPLKARADCPLLTQDVRSTQARGLGTKPQVKNYMGWNSSWKQKRASGLSVT